LVPRCLNGRFERIQRLGPLELCGRLGSPPVSSVQECELQQGIPVARISSESFLERTSGLVGLPGTPRQSACHDIWAFAQGIQTTSAVKMREGAIGSHRPRGHCALDLPGRYSGQ
jgi:hypothetical protein